MGRGHLGLLLGLSLAMGHGLSVNDGPVGEYVPMAKRRRRPEFTDEEKAELAALPPGPEKKALVKELLLRSRERR